MSSTALITGASGGIGCELAKVHASKGGSLVIVSRNSGKLSALGAELRSLHKTEVHVIAKDLAKENSCREVFDETESLGIRIDCLINNAGFGVFGKFEQTDWNSESEMISLNITAVAHLTKLYLPGMVKRGSGMIMNVASTAAFQPGPLMAVYYAGKAFVLNFSEAIANELQGTGVTVTALCPGPTRTGFQSAADIHESRLVKGRKLPSAEEVAEYGYKAMLKGKAVAIPGFMNKVLPFMERFVPRKSVVRLVRFIQDKRD